MTVGEWMDMWLAEAREDLKPRTQEGYEEAIRLYITPYPLAKVCLEDLIPIRIQVYTKEGGVEGLPSTNPPFFICYARTRIGITLHDIKQWKKILLNTQSARGGKPTKKKLAPSTVAIPFRRLRTALNAAVKEKLIAENPALKVKAPSAARQRNIVVLGEEDMVTLLKECAKHRLCGLFVLIALLGLRCSEVLGLRWQDFDHDAGTIDINGQLHRLRLDSSKPRQLTREDSTKTLTSTRVINIPPNVGELLELWRPVQAEERQKIGTAWRGGDFVFTSEAGGPLSHRNLLRAFKRLLKRAGLPQEMTLHDLRHCAASHMLARGENMEAVTEVLGHASSSITERTYAHALPEKKRKAGEGLGYLLNITKEEGT